MAHNTRALTGCPPPAVCHRCDPASLCLQSKSASSTFHKCWHDPLHCLAGTQKAGGQRRGRMSEGGGVGGCAERVSTTTATTATPPLHCVLCDLHACLVFFVCVEGPRPSFAATPPLKPPIIMSSAGTWTSSPNCLLLVSGQPSQSVSGGRVMPLDVFLQGQSRAATLLIFMKLEGFCLHNKWASVR